MADHSDVLAIETLVSVSAQGLGTPYYSKAQTDGAIGSVFGVDNQLLRDRTYFLAESGDEVIACGGWSKRKTLFGSDALKTGPDPLLNPKYDAARIRAFFVRPDWARLGVGRSILEQCEKAIWRAGFRSIELVATLSGEPFYASCNYIQTERFSVPLPNDLSLPVVRMVKNL